jgi:probable rRNA maturation factor
VTSRVVLRIEAPGWRRRLPAAERLVRRAAGAALLAARRRGRRGPAVTGELCIVLADDRLQRRLNRAFRGRDKSTNVLSFEGAPEGLANLGDVVLALGTIAREAKAQDKRLADHVTHLVIHGVLHLMGYDHEKESEALRMERLETRILAGLDIADPYGAAPHGAVRGRAKPRRRA